MTQLKAYLLSIFCLLGFEIHAQQITGYVTDAETGDSIPYASVVYKGHHINAISGR